MRKKIAPIALGLALAIAAQGCYGKFQATRNLYKWNGAVSGDKWVKELVFLGLCLLPYEAVGIADAVAFNSLEFWTGKNPMNAKLVTQGDQQAALHYDKATDIVSVTAFDKGVQVSETFLKREGDRILTLDKAGKILYTAGADMNGVASLADAKGLIVAQSVQQ